jgi:hypothetical protein
MSFAAATPGGDLVVGYNITLTINAEAVVKP